MLWIEMYTEALGKIGRLFGANIWCAWFTCVSFKKIGVLYRLYYKFCKIYQKKSNETQNSADIRPQIGFLVKKKLRFYT